MVHARRPGHATAGDRFAAAGLRHPRAYLRPDRGVPYAPERIYTPPDATWSTYRRMLDTLGVERAVLTQPSVYGTDNTAMVDALKTGGHRYVAWPWSSHPSPMPNCVRCTQAGVRGVRINIVDRRENRNVMALNEIMPLARRIAPLGWHIEFLLQADAVPDLAAACGQLPVPVVLGHLGYVHADKGGASNPGFQALLRLLDTGRCWVKLTGPYRISAWNFPIRTSPRWPAPWWRRRRNGCCGARTGRM